MRGSDLNKKLTTPPKDGGGDPKINLDIIVISAIERGLDYSAVSKMSIGQIVDFCIEYNNRQQKNEEKNKPKARKATQQDIDAFFGG